MPKSASMNRFGVASGRRTVQCAGISILICNRLPCPHGLGAPVRIVLSVHALLGMSMRIIAFAITASWVGASHSSCIVERSNGSVAVGLITMKRRAMLLKRKVKLDPLG